jgi:menaquinol-cytochrome c reductase iron-sulfur subunit
MMLQRKPIPETRRGFYVRAIYALSGLITAALALPAVAYLMAPPRSRKNDGWMEAADAGSLPLNSPEEVIFRRNRVDGWKVVSEKTSAWVVKTGENQVVAFAPQCTHLGCAYHWDDRNHNFLCPCHTSTFALDGKVLTGPAPRPLDRYQTRIEGGKLMLGAIEKGREA